MIENIIGEIEAKIRAETISDSRKKELLQSLSALRTEVAALAKTNAQALEYQAALKRSAEELRSSLTGFEQSHPKLLQAVNSITNTLANIGI